MEMEIFKLLFIICSVVIVLCIDAYWHTRQALHWYKAEYEKLPRLIKTPPKRNWRQKVMDCIVVVRSAF